MILGDILKALGQLGDPRFRRVLLLGLGLTLLLLCAVYALVFLAVQWLVPEALTLPLVGRITWVDDLLSGASLLLMIALSAVLMIPVASAFTGIFLEDVAGAVEDRHYPGLPPASPVPMGEALRDQLNFLGVLILANLAALVLYIFLAPLAPLIFWALNGFLLGREYFQVAAMRRIGHAEAKRAFRRHIGRIWLAGGLMAVPLTVPVLNLVVPIVGAATFTHLFHRLEAPSG